jgi:hypothetical protein
MAPSVRSAPVEARSTWLGVLAIVLAILAFDAWLTLGGASPGKVGGSLSESPILSMYGGQTKVFKPGRLDEGSVIACSNEGIVVSAAVPQQGRHVTAHIDSPTGNTHADLKIDHRSDGSVRLVCGSG